MSLRVPTEKKVGRTVQVVRSKEIKKVANFRSDLAIEKLVERLIWLQRVVGPLDLNAGPFVAGGAIFRTLMAPGLNMEDGDLDVFIPIPRSDTADEALEEFEVKLETARFEKLTDHSGSDGIRGRWLCKGPQGEPVHLDVIPVEQRDCTAGETVARFDIRACALATDGRGMLWVNGARGDLAARRLMPLRPTTPSRIRKYIAHGLDTHGIEPDRITGLLGTAYGIEGWTLQDHAKHDQIMGYYEPVEVVYI